jgi:ABC-type uncharacterized transport system ATPase subunit
MQSRLDEIRAAAPDRYVDITARGDLHPLLNLEAVAVVAQDDGHVRLRVPAGAEPSRVLQAVGADVIRVSYEAPTLSELFRRAVVEARGSAGGEVPDAHA